MGSKTRLCSYCTKRANNGVNLVTSRNINTRLARPILSKVISMNMIVIKDILTFCAPKYKSIAGFGFLKNHSSWHILPKTHRNTPFKHDAHFILDIFVS